MICNAVVKSTGTALFAVNVVLLCSCTSPGFKDATQRPFHAISPARLAIEIDGGLIETPGGIYVPADEEWIYTDSVEIRAWGPIVIDGVIRGRAPQSPSDPVPSMKLESISGIVIRGELHGFPGADGQVDIEAGGTGGPLIVRAPVLVLNEPLIAPPGGTGAPGGGKGGTGGRLEIHSAVCGPYYDNPEGPIVPVGNLIGGRGGFAGPPIGSLPGGPGGDGGGASAGLFREVPWMVEYRHFHLLSDEEIAEAKDAGEID